jgi:NifU-like protein involved in Fe-S cluster formation
MDAFYSNKACQYAQALASPCTDSTPGKSVPRDRRMVKMNHMELAGYDGYARHTRYRLILDVW